MLNIPKDKKNSPLMVFAICVIPQFNSSLNTIPMIFFRFVAIQSDLGQEIKHLE
jgi:hypothetical protein